MHVTHEDLTAAQCDITAGAVRELDRLFGIVEQMVADQQRQIDDLRGIAARTIGLAEAR